MSIKFLEVKRAYYADPENVVVQWRHAGDITWMDLIDEPSWNTSCDYRIRPRTIRIGDIDVPEPVREALKKSQQYFIAVITDSNFYVSTVWSDDNLDKICLARGLIHLTKEAAIEHAKALILVSGGKV